MQHRNAPVRADAIAEAAAALLLVVAMLFGGGSRGLGDLVVHLAAVPALALGVMRWRHAQATRLQRLFVAWLVVALAVIAVPLLPLPASVFGLFPARAAVLADLRSAGVDPAWLPLTLDAWGTVRAVLAFATFAAMWLLAITLPPASRERLLQLALGIAALMALLGFAQAAAGAHAPIRFYDYHHPVGAIGTFANRNHFASLLAMLVPCALAFALRAQRGRRPAAVGWYAVALVLLLASALSYSRAGFALTLLALLASAAMLLWRRDGRGAVAVPALVALVAVVAVGYYAWAGLMQRLEQDPLDDLRWQYVRHGWDAALHYLPWGSGAGSFQWVYAPFEPVGAMVQVYAARAHNDPLQVLVELGVPGVALALAFIALLAAAARKIPMGSAPSHADHSLRTVTVVAACVPLLHSAVDYPLRTLCVAVLLALLLTVVFGTHRTAVPGNSRAA